MLIVFDLDGTLIDSRRDLADATNALIEEYGGSPLAVDEVTAMVGEGAAVLVGRALAPAGSTLRRQARSSGSLRTTTSVSQATRARTRVSGGTRRASISRVDLAVLTNKPRRQTIEILDRLGLAPAFSDVVGGDTPRAASRIPLVSCRSPVAPAPRLHRPSWLGTLLSISKPPDAPAPASASPLRVRLSVRGGRVPRGELFVDSPLELYRSRRHSFRADIFFLSRSGNRSIAYLNIVRGIRL